MRSAVFARSRKGVLRIDRTSLDADQSACRCDNSLKIGRSETDGRIEIMGNVITCRMPCRTLRNWQAGAHRRGSAVGSHRRRRRATGRLDQVRDHAPRARGGSRADVDGRPIDRAGVCMLTLGPRGTTIDSAENVAAMTTDLRKIPGPENFVILEVHLCRRRRTSGRTRERR